VSTTRRSGPPVLGGAGGANVDDIDLADATPAYGVPAVRPSLPLIPPGPAGATPPAGTPVVRADVPPPAGAGSIGRTPGGRVVRSVRHDDTGEDRPDPGPRRGRLRRWRRNRDGD
jgi:hypothetical protein